ncbi:MAG TPA: rhodanese-like domain-containing protein [Bryobacteraceae bacterium]|nr:rhodanese-like domain-containing protein [Bryobacteraceae bacterium]
MKHLVVLLALLVCFAGFAGAQNLTVEEIEKHLESPGKTFFLDVRSADEIKKNGSVPGYVNIPLDQLEKRMSEVPKDKTIVTMCERGKRAASASDMLRKAGYTVAGSCGLQEYREKGKKLVYPDGVDTKKG